MIDITTKLRTQIEGDFVALLDDWHSQQEVFDNELDAQIHRWYAEAKPVFPKRPYFSPSSANSCPRELYVKAKGAERDIFPRKPYQTRWQKIGTEIGGIIQRDLLYIEKHYERLTGNKPRFVIEKTPDGRPMFEDFAKTNVLVNHAGEQFYLYGAPDGIMRYTTDDGEIIRVGLEIKSKQTTAARTSIHSMRGPELSHAKQAIAYSHMFGCDYYIILYVNAAKQAWDMSDEQYEKNPDIRAFCVHITDVDRMQLFDSLAAINKAIRTDSPPPLDIDKWAFNNYKTACALSLSDDELADLRAEVRRVMKSRLPEWKKARYLEVLEFIEEVRNGQS